MIVLNAGTVATITAIGVAGWDYGSHSFNICQDWGYPDNDAILIGAASSWLTMSLIEVGDGFSKSQGYSWQDEVMNTAGVGMAYLRHRFPAIRERVDFRWEWFPSPAARAGERFDILTDYQMPFTCLPTRCECD